MQWRFSLYVGLSAECLRFFQVQRPCHISCLCFRQPLCMGCTNCALPCSFLRRLCFPQRVRRRCTLPLGLSDMYAEVMRCSCHIFGLHFRQQLYLECANLGLLSSQLRGLFCIYVMCSRSKMPLGRSDVSCYDGSAHSTASTIAWCYPSCSHLSSHFHALWCADCCAD